MYTMIPLLPFFPFPLTWNPPCCDRICPLLPWVARKLTLAFPPFAHLAPPHPKSRPPGVSQTQNRHSLGRHCKPNPYARFQLFSTFGPIRRSVIWCSLFFDLLSFGVRSFGVRSFGVRSFGVRSFGVGSFGVGSFGVRSFNVQSFGVQ